MSAIELRGLTKVYPGGVKALDSLDLAIPDGEFFALLGPSGCGKTTLLRTIAGLETATGGAVVIGDRDVTGLQPGARDIAMVFQDYALFPHMNVTDNIAYPLRIKKVGRAARQQKAAEVGARLGLEQLMDRRPGQLSGGQQQRVALARVMATQAQAFLFDEPLSNLDARLRLEARTFLKKLQHELGVTTVFVTHDQAEALAMADRMAVMESGHIRQIGTPAEVFQRPANTFVAGFIGSTPMNLLDGVVRADTLEVTGCKLAVPQSAEGLLHDGEKIVYGVRPEYNVYSAEPVDGSLGGNVSIVENLGASYLVTLDVNGVLVQAVVPEGHEPAIGDEGYALPRRDRALIYRDGELVSA
ncbi:ABC transporter ATP-binding protein [Planotetraspora mira]|jgi:multiple sugar transport system ATP-binding protein|uniref:Sugar ABC transporter ATP-binding protein n=1 Tax=Planotetraspora mira TaxID=58121 RepID=A0A8J3TIS7_9ACTN|nr:ABC transporter ATP-binding protein [Planotetraspora mira]GII27818.1 sugar ABC transporter ATP-binding protein [Planotetraspora mira]